MPSVDAKYRCQVSIRLPASSRRWFSDQQSRRGRSHDHLFVKQELDGIVYQEVPQPGHPRSGNTNTAKEYGYLSGETQSSSGFIRVSPSGFSTMAFRLPAALLVAGDTQPCLGTLRFQRTSSYSSPPKTRELLCSLGRSSEQSESKTTQTVPIRI